MFMSSCNWISNNKNITYYLSTRTPTSTENCLYQLREFVLCNKWSVYAYICSPPLYRSLFSKFVNFFIFWMNNLTHVKFDIHSLWSLIFFFFWLSSMFCLFFKIRHDFAKAKLHAEIIYFIAPTKRKHLSLSFFILFVSLPPL